MSLQDNRLPPHDLAAEEAVNGSLLINDNAIHEVAPFLKPEDFFSEPGRFVYEAALDLFQRGEPIDQVTMAQELERQQRLERVGGAAYLVHLLGVVPTSLDAGHYGKIVRNSSIARSLVVAGTQITNLAYDEGCTVDLGTAVNKAKMLIAGIEQQVGPSFIDHPEFSVLGNDSFRAHWQGPSVTIELSRLQPSGNVEIEVIHGVNGHSKTLVVASHNLLRQNEFFNLIKALEGSRVTFPWREGLTKAFAMAMQHFKEGTPSQKVGRKPEGMSQTWQVYPISERGQITEVYGAGGGLKTYLAIYNMLGCQLLPFYPKISDYFSSLGLIPMQANGLYLDWESSKESMDRRCWAIKAGWGITNDSDDECFEYLSCDKPLLYEMDRIRRVIESRDITFVVIDSQMAASRSGTNPDQLAGEFFNAVRTLGCTAWVVDHSTKADARGDTLESSGPFGSVVKYNRARAVWEVRGTHTEGDEFYDLSLKNVKNNDSQLFHTIGIRARFYNTPIPSRVLQKVEFEHLNLLNDSPELAQRTVGIRRLAIDYFTKTGNKRISIEKLAAAIGKAEASVRAELYRQKGTFDKNMEGLWGLIDPLQHIE
ncbi:AAA domain-containing protein [Dehalogenimonas formicexedens]|uniref:AAA domain-containing protein n=1 Tax=Dehalogenimonas formicexedens TaxID=1839801 RepID=A0A1P8F7M6_9CHLR|nr:DnaB-like helicase N-terminal domain-containing protein [Dehalogenimonas formicexedens]APV44474.1 AAA domain-containing protein [Dehalogenimonas formicexedens]